NLSPPLEIEGESQRAILDQLKIWNQRHFAERADDSNLAARISNYELAFRMQMAGPELIDLSKEPEHIRKMYGLDGGPAAKFGQICLLARRMVERALSRWFESQSLWASQSLL